MLERGHCRVAGSVGPAAESTVISDWSVVGRATSPGVPATACHRRRRLY